jgi:hypothetical protein
MKCYLKYLPVVLILILRVFEFRGHYPKKWQVLFVEEREK